MRTRQLLFSFLGLTLFACGSSGTPTPDAAPGETYPAFTVPLPQLMSSGGPVLATPHLTSVTFAGETRTADLDQFVATLPTLTSWTGVLAQYGVTGMTAETPIHSSTALEGTVSDSVMGGTSEIHDLLTAIIGQSNPDPDAIYVVFIPAGVGIEIDGQPFFGGEAYHFHFAVGTTDISYVVVPYPADTVTTLGGQTLAGADAMTGITSHEIAEAATDPLTPTTPAYGAIPLADGVAWGTTIDSSQTEIGDICAPTPDAIYKPDGFGYYVQHLWSNSAAAAGHNPCQPRAAGEVYFVAVPKVSDPIMTAAGTSAGLTLHTGTAKTVSVQLSSDAATSGPWTLSCEDKDIQCVFDPPTGKNGDTVQLTLTNAQTTGPYVFFIYSTLGDSVTDWPFIVQVPN